ncbi:MAG: hypothetical protein O3C27_13585 [Actinomycetota bacterium]|nr:hypothetical protein [Actinomycetota bacterium]
MTEVCALPVEPAAVPVPRPQLAQLPPPAPDPIAERAVLRPAPVPPILVVESPPVATQSPLPAQRSSTAPAPAPAEPAPASIFVPAAAPSREQNEDLFTVARRVQLTAPIRARRSAGRRVSRPRSVVIGVACLVIGLAAGFAVGTRVGADDLSGGAPTNASE